MADPISASILIAGALASGASVYSGEKGAQSQRKALRQQEQAQREASAQAQKSERIAQEAQAKVNRQAPDVTSMLSSAAQGAMQGGASTLLAGKNIDPLSLNLGRSTLLGQ